MNVSPRSSSRPVRRSRQEDSHAMQFAALGARAMMATTADFNGDGFEDLAIGAPGGNLVSVTYGSTTGLKPEGAVGVPAVQLWTQFLLGEQSSSSSFGHALAVGDFDQDGFDDLAIGAPFRGTFFGVLQSQSGGVYVVYGTQSGLATGGNQFWNQDSPGIEGVNGGFERFGFALAAGDFDGDGFDDLACGVPGEALATGVGANRGAINVIYGTTAGLNASGDQFFSQSSLGIPGDSDKGDRFGNSLASGDFDRDGFDDLAIGIPGERVALRDKAGEVLVMYGTAGAGLQTAGNQVWNLSNSSLNGSPARDDAFGSALAAGDFNGDLFDDLAIGIPGRDVNGFNEAGEIRLLRGGSSGLTLTGNQRLNQDVTSVADSAEAFDRFGSSLSAGDFNGDGKADLVVGVANEDFAGAANAGAAHLFFGANAGITVSGARFFSQGVTPFADTREGSDAFAAAVGSGDYNGDGKADLVIGVPGENGNGLVQVLNGAASGFATTSKGFTGASSSQFGGGLAGGAPDTFSGFSGSGLSATQIVRKTGRRPAFDFNVRLTVTNPGSEPTARSRVRFFLSDDAVLDRRDRTIGQVKLGALDAGESVDLAWSKRLARGRSFAGKYLIAVLDFGDGTAERNEANNVIVFGPVA